VVIYLAPLRRGFFRRNITTGPLLVSPFKSKSRL